MTVGDDISHGVEAVRHAAAQAELVVMTGGLGPTADDLTRHYLREVAAVPLELNTQVLAHIEQLFASRQREMPEQNRVQAEFPRGSRVIPNPYGSAPGIDLTIETSGRSCRFFALPGVPAEMRDMWPTVAGRIVDLLPGSTYVIRHRQLKCFGVGESDLEKMLPRSHPARP